MVCEICEVIELDILDYDNEEITLDVDFEGEYVSGSTGEEYQEGYNKGYGEGKTALAKTVNEVLAETVKGENVSGELDEDRLNKLPVILEETKTVVEDKGVEVSDPYLLDDISKSVNEVYEKGLAESYPKGFADGKAEGVTEGYEQGKTDGYNDGHEIGYTEGHKNGYDECKAEGNNYYDAFWDSFQNKGKRTYYQQAFEVDVRNEDTTMWNNESFKPKYDLKPIEAKAMFGMAQPWSENERKPDTGIHGDLVELLEKCGVKLDLSNVTNSWGIFQESNFTRLGVLDLSNVTYIHESWFFGCIYLETIDLLIPPKKNNAGGNNSNFNRCKSLKNLTLGGNWLKDTDLSYSPLTLESAISVITHLENYAGTENEFVYSALFSETTWELLDAEGETASPNGNSWRDYIGDLGWIS